MRIYIVSLPLQKINLNALLKNPNLSHTIDTYIELYSKDDGQYKLSNNKIIRFEPNFQQKIEIIKSYEGWDLLVDSTEIKEIEVLSQLPTEYVKLNIKEYCFFMGNKGKSTIKLFVKYLEDDINSRIIDYYLDYNGEKMDFDNIFFRENINMFLSVLN